MQIDVRPPPYAPQHGAKAEEEGRSSVKFRATDTRGWDQKGGGAVCGGEEKSEPNRRTGSPAIPFKAEMPLERRRSRRSGTRTHQKSRGQSRSKNHRRQEVSDHSTSSHSEEEEVKQVSKPVREGWYKGREYKGQGIEFKGQCHTSGESSDDSDSSTDTEDTPAVFFKHTDLPMRHTHRKKTKSMPLTDWGKVQTALADLPEAAARIFPVKKLDNNLPTYSPVNPKEVHAIAKAIAEKGINSAMVSTLINGLFGNDDMLPFDIKQTCRMIFDGAGMIVFKQEWEDNLEKMLAKASGDQHSLRNSSLQR
ncbi:hypothetical protein HGM15179_017986 [Zosterops borbonicus]|uniref:Uncharacterized protein n=1 Tax=Zosterops borbonicus TaxID=364589 RepID=A0A8K1LCR1_9PASS|nr:hypothetical protein HGM15179_017986 [Zosterops borbonicus]